MVLKCEPQQGRLLLSFRLSSRPVPEGGTECTPKKKQEVKYQIGEVLNSMTIPFFVSKCSLKKICNHFEQLCFKEKLLEVGNQR